MDEGTKVYFKSKSSEWGARYTHSATKYTKAKAVADSTCNELQHLKVKKSGREFYDWWRLCLEVASCSKDHEVTEEILGEVL